jgi:NADH-quinone oxidoreductase subunit B
MNASLGRPAPALEYLTTKKDELIGWARKFSLFPYPFVTACWVPSRPRRR